MNFKNVVNNCKLTVMRNKGLILTVSSAAFEIGALIAMAKQAPKAEKVLIPANKKIAKLREELNDTEAIANHRVYPEDNKREIRKIQLDTFKKLTKIYAIPVILAGASLATMGGSYKVMRDKELALGAAYVTIDNAFKAYRNRVKEAIGEEKENLIFRDVKKIPVKKTIVDENTGEVKEVEEVIEKATSGGGYEVAFDAASLLWSDNGRTNYETLAEVENKANMILKTEHVLFLYDVFQMLDLPKSIINKDILAASRCVGWIYDPYDPNRSSWVSFGIRTKDGHCLDTAKPLFDNIEKDIILSFNPDGNIITSKHGKPFTYYVKD